MVVQQLDRSVLPGAAGNVALNLSALGAKVSLLGTTGRDDVGEEVARHLSAAGVDTSALLPLSGRQTPSKTRIWAGDAHTVQQQVLRIDRDIVGQVPARVGLELCDHLQSKEFDAIIIVDYGYGLLTRKVLTRVAALSKHRPVIADSRYRIREFKDLTAIKPNEAEAEAAIGFKIRDIQSLNRAGQRLLAKTRASMALMTRGNLGMSLFLASGEVFHIPIWGSKDIVDVSGAGDTVGALFSAGLGLKATPLEAACLANIAASVVVMKKGAASVSLDELLLSMNDEHIKNQGAV